MFPKGKKERVTDLSPPVDVALASVLELAFRSLLGVSIGVEATVNFRLFEGIGVVRGCGRPKLSEKRMHFVREKREKPPAGAFMREKDCEKSEKSEKRPTRLRSG